MDSIIQHLEIDQKPYIPKLCFSMELNLIKVKDIFNSIKLEQRFKIPAPKHSTLIKKLLIKLSNAPFSRVSNPGK